MTLIKSISGIRGTIGGAPGGALTPVDIVKFTAAYAATLPQRKPQPNGGRYKVVVGKDARLSGDMVEQLVVGTLMGCGVDVVRCGFARRMRLPPMKGAMIRGNSTEASAPYS